VGRLCPDLVAVEPFQVLSPDGTLQPGEEPTLSPDEVVTALRLMLLSRRFDERATAMNRQGRFGGFAPASGQEGCLVGSALALDPGRDWMVPQYRELPALVHHGYPLERLAAFSLGKADAARVPDGVRMLPLQFSLAAQLPHAVGVAWGLSLLGQPGVVLAYCGEGATSEGDFHEACNLAGVLRAPVVFLVQDNGWAISTPRSRQSAAPNLAARALGYGFEGVVVDGNDLLAVYAVTCDAVRTARSGAGPTLIEAQTFRLADHNMTDDPRRYRRREDVDAARLRDPITRVQRYLRSLGSWTEEDERAMADSVTGDVERALEAAFALPAQRPSDLFEHVRAAVPSGPLRHRGEIVGDGAV